MIANSTYTSYPFGMQMPNRQSPVIAGDEHRYGFQGQELDDEIKSGRGTSVNYKYRMHDPRVGRFFAVDPLAYSYPYNSPYAFSQNRVIDGVELEGAEFIYYGVIGENTNGDLHVASTGEVEHSTWVHSVVEIMGGNIEAFEVYVLEYNGKGYIFTDKDELFTANSNNLEGRPTKEGLEGIFMMTDALGGATVAKMANRVGRMQSIPEVKARPKLNTKVIVPSAERKLETVAKKFNISKKEILNHSDSKGVRYVDNLNNKNINVLSPRPDGKDGFVRVTLSPEGDKIISSGLVKKKDVSKAIDSGRFTKQDGE